MKIISTSELQKQIGQFTKSMDTVLSYIIVSRGKPKVVMLPYFDNCDQSIEDYLETYEIQKNQKNIQKTMEKSLASGKSELVI